MTTFTEYFKIVLFGEKEESRKAARQVRKLLYSSSCGRSKYEDIRPLINDAPQEYIKISEDWRQENFVMAISVLYFLHHRDSQPDFLFPWLFELLQHDNGNIRHAAVRMFENELGPLTYHIRCPGEQTSFHKFKTDQADRILSGLYSNLIDLINNLSKPSYNKYKLITSLPSGPFKSVQMVMSHLKEDCGEKYVKDLEERYAPQYIDELKFGGLCDCEICKRRNLRSNGKTTG